MTDASYKQAQKLMRQLNHLRSEISKQKGQVARWTAIESSNLELGKSIANVTVRIRKEIEKLNSLKNMYAAIQFPAHDIPNEKINEKFCRICQTQISNDDEYCLICYENQNIPKYDFTNKNDKDFSE